MHIINGLFVSDETNATDAAPAALRRTDRASEEETHGTQLATLAEPPSRYASDLAAMSVIRLRPSLRTVLPHGKPNRASLPLPGAMPTCAATACVPAS